MRQVQSKGLKPSREISARDIFVIECDALGRYIS